MTTDDEKFLALVNSWIEINTRLIAMVRERDGLVERNADLVDTYQARISQLESSLSQANAALTASNKALDVAVKALDSITTYNTHKMYQEAYAKLQQRAFEALAEIARIRSLSAEGGKKLRGGPTTEGRGGE